MSTLTDAVQKMMGTCFPEYCWALGASLDKSYWQCVPVNSMGLFSCEEQHILALACYETEISALESRLDNRSTARPLFMDDARELAKDLAKQDERIRALVLLRAGQEVALHWIN